MNSGAASYLVCFYSVCAWNVYFVCFYVAHMKFSTKKSDVDSRSRLVVVNVYGILWPNGQGIGLA